MSSVRGIPSYSFFDRVARVFNRTGATRAVALDIHASLIIRNTFISKTSPKLQNIKQKLSNTDRLNFRCLKMIHFFYPYYPNIMIF